MLVAVELKNTEFRPEYAGKMNFYLSLLNERVKKLLGLAAEPRLSFPSNGELMRRLDAVAAALQVPAASVR